MDPIAFINIKKDSSFAMLLEAQRRGWSLFYMQQKDLFMTEQQSFAQVQALTVEDNKQGWFQLEQAQEIKLADLDVILMRKDPPFDMEYIYTTYLLEVAEKQGTLIINKPQSIRDCNEKLFTLAFPQCCPPLLVTREQSRLLDFIKQHQDCILKPLDGMGGASIFRVQDKDPNNRVIIETLTQYQTKTIMAQRYIAEIKAGDKRILMVNGKPIPYALARIPSAQDHRGNLAAGGKGRGQPLTKRDYWIAEQVGAELKRRGLFFVGLDVIGDYLTEINVTSPTCIRELDQQFNLNISGVLFDSIEKHLDLN